MGIAVVFPGQGSQAPAMGRGWADHPCWQVVEQAEAATGERLSHLLLSTDADVLARTRDAQLALFLQGLVAFEAIRHELGPRVVAFAGHSLGQITALVAAGVMDVADGARFVSARATATQRAADREPGRMAALVGATIEQAEAACQAAPDACWVANDNAPGQVVVAGTPAGLAAATVAAESLGIRRVVALDVGGAFHTPLMASSSEAIAGALDGVRLGEAAVPVVSNADAMPYTDGAGWSERLVAHPTRPVRWRASVERLAALGATTFVEAGARTLTALIRRTLPDATALAVTSPADMASLPVVAP